MHRISNQELEQFKRKISQSAGLNLEHYKNCQLDRRLLAMMEREDCRNLEDYYQLLDSDSKKMDALLDYLTINVSEFMRNPAKFQELKHGILPMLGANRNRIRIWSAGCSMGAEIYSVVMLMDQLNLLSNGYFIGTDIDQRILSKAKQGLFSQEALNNVSRNDLNYFFTPSTDGEREISYQFKEQWRSKVQFFPHDLLSESYPRYFDLIICRNVMIYFNEDAKRQTYMKFFDSLKENGVLFIGGTEQMVNYTDLGYRMISPFFYQKPASRSPAGH